MRIKRFTRCFLVGVMLVMSLTGCALLDTVQALKGEPEVMDVSIIMEHDTVHVDVILYDNTNLANAPGLAEKYTAIVRKYYAEEDVRVSMIVPYREEK